MATGTYQLINRQTGASLGTLRDWFEAGQQCPDCPMWDVYVDYTREIRDLKEIVREEHPRHLGLWRYFDYLPIEDEANIVSLWEGGVDIQHWPFMDDLAREHFGIDCRVYAHRQDRSYATASFKDLAGTVVASALKELGIQQYVVASTGNIGVAFSRYLKEARISLTAFIPNTSPRAQQAEMACFGQQVYRVDGDYHMAKSFAEEFCQQHGVPNAAGSFDPLRIEGKKTMVYEWLRRAPEFPTVYVQALSGGTGPLGVTKGCDELEGHGFFQKRPRLVLVQSDKCAPMAEAWANARAAGFPEGWENDYPIYENPETEISTLATGNPSAYPALARRVHASDGEIITFPEERAVDVARFAAFEGGARIGPAAAISFGGLMRAFALGHIRNGDVVMLNVGEGIRRSPQFLERFCASYDPIATLDGCQTFNASTYREQLHATIADILQ